MQQTEERSSVQKIEQFVRFSLSQRAEHLFMMVSFTALVITGVPQKFFWAGWAQAIILALGGIEATRAIHHVFAAIFCLEAVYHAAWIALTVARGRFTPSMIPGLKDVRDAVANLKYCFGVAPRAPAYDRFDYRQKFEYWGVVMGSIIMIATGAVLLFPAEVTRLVPGALVPASREMHGGEALLAFSVIVIWHLYGSHLNPDRFPADTTIFTGRISRERMIEEHPLEYARLTGTPVEAEEVEVAETEPAGAPHAVEAAPERQPGS